MTISVDDAKEALASVEATSERTQELRMRADTGPTLVYSGLVGLFAFGLQSSQFRKIWGSELITDSQAFWQVMLLMTLCILPLVITRSAITMPMLKVKMNTSYNVLMFLVAGLIVFGTSFVDDKVGGALAAAKMAFSFGLMPALANMFWFGRQYALGAVTLILALSLIWKAEYSTGLSLHYITAFNGLILLPIGFWMMWRNRRQDA